MILDGGLYLPHYNQDHRLNSGSITDVVSLTHDPGDTAALVGLIGCSFRFRGYAPVQFEIITRIYHSSMNTYTHCCASKLCFALPCCRDVTRGAPSPESNDPTWERRRHWSDGSSPAAPTSLPARITAVQARVFTPLGTAVTSGSGSGGGAGRFLFGFGGVPFF